MATLAKAIALAASAHEGQTDRGGSPYVFHPIRLMLRAVTGEEQIIAVLHDTIEDTSLTLEDLRKEGFSDSVVEAVDSLSRREEEDYDAFILRIKQNPLASRVKILDLLDNIEQTKKKKPSEKTHKRLDKYSRALDTLLT
ncbi:GTP pyrophosphokinase [Paenibacillus sambharensis]|uniref:GTP pyrophosphokinase n=1 Tax=Paenibacillus sambharensis TaxID=1803190 RepID=A0A2W1LI17_9BACL|nr:HD domain-containing protein [Paenibacillus sambharensis]PZD94595.1 GTP pyrophosphokinase [Paenibacillus sambharensis]